MLIMKLYFVTFLLFIGIVFSVPEENEYVRQLNVDGNIVSEGWIKNGAKDGYWKFYDVNRHMSASGHYSANIKVGYWYEYIDGELSSQGHYDNNFKSNWWVYHNKMGYQTIKKQYVNGVIQGYVLFYKKSSLSKVDEYKANKKVGSWTSYFKFKKAHPNFSLSDFRN